MSTIQNKCNTNYIAPSTTYLFIYCMFISGMLARYSEVHGKN